jgi:hypothetical protein
MLNKEIIFTKKKGNKQNGKKRWISRRYGYAWQYEQFNEAGSEDAKADGRDY